MNHPALAARSIPIRQSSAHGSTSAAAMISSASTWQAAIGSTDPQGVLWNRDVPRAKKPLVSRVADGIRTRYLRYHKPASTRGATPAFCTAATGNPQIRAIAAPSSFVTSASFMTKKAEKGTDLRNPQTLIGPCSSHFSQPPEHSPASRDGPRRIHRSAAAAGRTLVGPAASEPRERERAGPE